MDKSSRVFHTGQPHRQFTLGDVIAIAVVAVLIYLGVRLAFNTPEVIRGPSISLAPAALPFYAALSLGRMAAAYFLSILFTLVYGRWAAYNRSAEKILMPLLDVLQSVPILSFLPVVLLSLSAILPVNIAAELASIVLIFTSQAWNLTFAMYQSLTTIPKELREASKIFRFNKWMTFKTLEMPFAGISLIWNSMMSWAGGWFFLMAAEIFTVGQRDFRLPGLGAYLQEAASQGNLQALFWGIGVLVLVIIGLDQFVWRPLLAWSDRFKLEMIESANPPTSWFYDLFTGSRIYNDLHDHLLAWLSEVLDAFMARLMPVKRNNPASMAASRGSLEYIAFSLLILGLIYGIYLAARLLFAIPLDEWTQIGIGLLATLVRVSLALLVTLAWTVPVGVLIGTSPRLSGVLQPVVQILASVPATALFPAFLLVLLRQPGGVDLSAEVLMLLGTQWYLLFNVIAGAAAIPQDLKYTATMLRLKRGERWRTLILPALFPYVITGAITASGGAWNASIVAEHIVFAGKTYSTPGIGSLIANATASGNYPLLLAATLSMILVVVLVNRLLWRRLYILAEEQYRLE